MVSTILSADCVKKIAPSAARRAPCPVARPTRACVRQCPWQAVFSMVVVARGRIMSMARPRTAIGKAAPLA